MLLNPSNDINKDKGSPDQIACAINYDYEDDSAMSIALSFVFEIATLGAFDLLSQIHSEHETKVIGKKGSNFGHSVLAIKEQSIFGKKHIYGITLEKMKSESAQLSKKQIDEIISLTEQVESKIK